MLSWRDARWRGIIYATKFLAAAEIITSPAGSHRNIQDRGVDMHRPPLDEDFCEEGAGDRDGADQQREGEHLRGNGEAEHGDLTNQMSAKPETMVSFSGRG